LACFKIFLRLRFDAGLLVALGMTKSPNHETRITKRNLFRDSQDIFYDLIKTTASD